MAPSVDSIATSVANSLSNGLAGDVRKKTSGAGSLLPTTETTQIDIVERILADAGATDQIKLDGYTLTLGDVVGAARRGRTVKVADSPQIREKIDASVEFLRTQ